MNQSVTISTPSPREIQMFRVFDAPRPLVFDCWTKPDLIRKWLTGPPGWMMTECEVELWEGGRYRYKWRDQPGHELAMGGVYREIVAPERLVQTELFDQDWTGGETISTLVLLEQDGQTTATTTVLYSSEDVCEGALQSGMAKGVEASYTNLDRLLQR